MLRFTHVSEFMNALDSTSTRPYLVRALYEWCTDNGLTPYVAVSVDDTVMVPREYVKNNEIVLNISFDATSSLKLGNEFIEFKARFAGSSRDILVPMSRVIAIYARENGQGMAFPLHPTGEAGSSLPKTSEIMLVNAVTSALPEQEFHDSESNIIKLVPTENKVLTSDDDLNPPEPPKPTQGSRPSLRRVK